MRAGCLVFLLLSSLTAEDALIQRFPLEAYRALGEPWLADRSEAPLFPAGFQARKARAFRAELLAPWDRAGVAKLLTPAVLGMEARRVVALEAEVADEEGFGPNFRPYGAGWLEALRRRLPEVPAQGYSSRRRAITVEHAALRLLPTSDPYRYSHTLPGQGYPFDLLQNSVLWAGTPVYVLAETPDRAWCKVVTSSAAGWVQARTLALAGPRFLRRWRGALARHGLAAAIRTEAPLLDGAGRFRGSAYVGSVFPRWPGPGRRLGVLVPARDAATLRAVAVRAFLPEGGGVRQPWAYTPASAAVVLKALLGRPYRSLLWIPGHVMLFLGPVPGGVMTHQNLWGLRPKEPPDYRSIVGGSVLFPVLETYPEAPGLLSLAARSALTVTQLDE